MEQSQELCLKFGNIPDRKEITLIPGQISMFSGPLYLQEIT
jgi:hypothetical protein